MENETVLIESAIDSTVFKINETINDIFNNPLFRERVKLSLNIKEGSQSKDIKEKLGKIKKITIERWIEKDILINKGSDANFEIVIKVPINIALVGSGHVSKPCNPGDIACGEIIIG